MSRCSSSNGKSFLCHRLQVEQLNRYIIKSKITDDTEDPVGKTTIGTFKLNDREDLVERRRQRWEEYNDILDNICLLEKISADDRFSDLDIQSHLQKEKDLLATQSEFTGMFKYHTKDIKDNSKCNSDCEINILAIAVL